MKNKTFRTLLVLLVATMLLFSFTFSASAADRYDFSEKYDRNATVRAHAMLQADIDPDYDVFEYVYGSISYLQLTATVPAYDSCYMSIQITGTGTSPTPSEQGVVDLNRSISVSRNMDEFDGSEYLNGTHFARISGSNEIINPPNTSVSVD